MARRSPVRRQCEGSRRPEVIDQGHKHPVRPRVRAVRTCCGERWAHGHRCRPRTFPLTVHGTEGPRSARRAMPRCCALHELPTSLDPVGGEVHAAEDDAPLMALPARRRIGPVSLRQAVTSKVIWTATPDPLHVIRRYRSLIEEIRSARDGAVECAVELWAERA